MAEPERGEEHGVVEAFEAVYDEVLGLDSFAPDDAMAATAARRSS